MEKRAIVLEAINELHISEEPSFYKKIRSWVRKNIKRRSVEPVDVINWPKGCLTVGLMMQARKLENADNSADRALSIYAYTEVKDYIDRWADRGCPIYKIDNCLFGQSLLHFADMFKRNIDKMTASEENRELREGQLQAYDRYISMSDKFYGFLMAHDKDKNDSLPYRPAHKTGDIYADGVGMAAPFLVGYGVARNNEDAILLGVSQIKAFCENAIDSESGLPFHAYSLKDGLKQYAPGWGRALGWLFYGVGASLEFLIGPEGKSRPESFAQLSALREIKICADKLMAIASCVIKENGLFGSDLGDVESPVDSSATAMILYGMKMCNYLNDGEEKCYTTEKIEMGVEALKQYITPDGLVINAQGECMGLGIYSDSYGSYPWSVGMTLNII